MKTNINTENLSFSQAIRIENKRLKETLPLQHRVYSYVDRGYYLEQIRRIYRYFCKDQVLILKYDEYRNNIDFVLNNISDFLSISKFDDIRKNEVHVGKYSSSMKIDDKKYLQDLYYHEIKQLEQMLSWDCSDWLR
jgi:DNA-binding transcriptional MerR regulator